jgi:hypothetical protein
MGYQMRVIRLFKTVLLAVVVAAGFLSIIATNDSCLEIGEPCTGDGECCVNHCEDGRCCRSVGADLDSDEGPSSCCSGAIGRDPDTGAYCCGTEGMAVSVDDPCCEGMSRDPETGACSRCPSPCYWSSEPAVVGTEPECVCPDDDTTTPSVPIPPCSICDDPSASDCWFYTVYHEGYYGPDMILGQGCRLYGPFYAPDADAAENCARAAAVYEGFSREWAWVVEEYAGPLGAACLR